MSVAIIVHNNIRDINDPMKTNTLIVIGDRKKVHQIRIPEPMELSATIDALRKLADLLEKE